jgi:hypothetical protein
LYLNGDLIGADDDPTTVETFDVAFKRRANNVAVVVEHDGEATGYGLFCVLEVEEDAVQIVSSPTDRATPWFWTGALLPNEDDADWMTLRQNRLAGHEEDGVAVVWSPAQAGNLAPASFPEFSDLDQTRTQSVAGIPGGLDGSSGGLQLRSLVGENTAFRSLTSEPRLVDGDVNTSKSFRKGAAALLQQVETDLGRLVVADRVRVLTEPPSRGSFEDVSLRGYSILISKDGVSFLEVGSRTQITTFQETEVTFPPTPARHVRLVVTEFSNRDAAPRVGELEVYGSGIAPAGTYLSQALDFGTQDLKNFDRAEIFGQAPPQALLQMRFRSGDDGTSWSEWTAWSGEGESVIPMTVPEPRRFLQFQASMETRDLFAGPRLDSLALYFQSGDMPATGAVASVTPSLAPIGQDTTFTYRLRLDLQPDDLGIARLVILTPWPSQLDVAGVVGLTGGVSIDPAGTYATNDSLVIAFSPPITSAAGIEEISIPFTTRLMSASHRYRGLLFAPGGMFPLLVQEDVGIDPETDLPLSILSSSRDFSIGILSDVMAEPAAFSPNGDDINDEVVIGFSLGRVSGAAVRLEIYDLAGLLVRTLPETRLSAGRHAPMAGRAADLPATWDGRADDGDLVPPGSYIYRLVVDVEPDEVTSVGIVGVVY